MNIKILANSHTPIYQQIVDQVSELAASGRAEPGERLPSVRGLAETLLINPNTVARAYRELESAGVILTRPGDGAFVVDQSSPFRARQRRELLVERVDSLVAVAEQFGVERAALLELVDERMRKIEGDGRRPGRKRA